ncbi:helix-hairpin-helix domain-containing protein [Saccharicrinis sp. FJH62]|uniref:helix-hairpin-helix domain-containing protein n=1 Tax=Saccharicrinis sp. FJH62 TaxID=3344657 RepID=UPI0035D3F08F
MWKDWFFYSRRERNGIIILIILLLILLIARLFMPTLVNHKPYDYSYYQSKIDSFKHAMYMDSLRQVWLTEDHFNRDSLSVFDPNTADSLTMRRLGFGSISITNITRYRNSGGSFREAKDLGRIYSISDSELVVLKPFIRISRKEKSLPDKVVEVTEVKAKEEKRVEYVSIEKEPEIVIELNSADTALLKMLPGIGSVLSERIVKYRSWLGGFYSQDQLKEVYGLKPDVVHNISDQLTIDTTLLVRLNPNTVSVNQLKGHPYLNFYQAKAIYEYRRDKKPIENFEELMRIQGLDTVKLGRIKPYLSFSDVGTSE